MSRFSLTATAAALQPANADRAGQIISSRNAGWHAVRIVVAAILLLAAGLKGHQLATEPVPETSLLTSRWFLITAVEVELLLGLWLMFGVFAKLGWIVALVCFVTFAHVALYKFVTGEASCGCFGRVEVSPLWTLLLDVGVVAALLRFRPRIGQTETATHRTTSRWASGSLVLPVTAFLAAGIPGGVVMATYDPARITDAGRVIGDSEFVLLEPETWVGKEFPLLGHIDIGEQLAHGKWMVVLYHYDCPKCQELMPKYEQLASKNDMSGREGRIALIEMPPYETNITPVRSACVRGQLSDTREWFAQAPVELLMDDGKVKRIVTRRNG